MMRNHTNYRTTQWSATGIKGAKHTMMRHTNYHTVRRVRRPKKSPVSCQLPAKSNWTMTTRKLTEFYLAIPILTMPKTQARRPVKIILMAIKYGRPEKSLVNLPFVHQLYLPTLELYGHPTTHHLFNPSMIQNKLPPSWLEEYPPSLIAVLCNTMLRPGKIPRS